MIEYTSWQTRHAVELLKQLFMEERHGFI